MNRIHIAAAMLSVLAIAASPLHAQEKRKRAVLVGINTYQHLPNRPLSGTLNDVELMKDVLTSRRYGFKAADIKILKNEQAKRQAILDAIDTHLIKDANPGDIVVLHVSAHGSLAPNPVDPTGEDNTIVPWDSRDPDRKVTDIHDKELNARVRLMFKKVGAQGAVAIVLDTCHSGTGAKGATPRVVEKDDRWANNKPPPLDLGGLAGTEAGTKDVAGSGYGVTDEFKYVLLAGSRSDQSSYEMTAEDGKIYGTLTYYLTRELRKEPVRKRTYRDVMLHVRRLVNNDKPKQDPQLEGSDKDRVVFGDETIETKTYFEAEPNGTGLVKLRAGRLHGMMEGSEFELYGQDAHTFTAPDVPLTTITLTTVQEFDSVGKMSNAVTLAGPVKAIERKHAFQAGKTPVLYEGLANSSILKAIKSKLESGQNKPFTSAAAGARFVFRLTEEEEKTTKIRKIHLYSSDGGELGSPLESSLQNVADRMEERMLGWDRWFSLLTLDHPGSPLNVSVTLTPTGTLDLYDRGRLASFTPGENKFGLKVSNDSERSVFIYILDLTSRGKVELVYPDDNGLPPIKPGEKRVIDDWSTALPNGISKTRDVFKVIATTEPTDLSYLTQDTPRGDQPRGMPPTDPLGRLLWESAMGVKDASRKTPATWTTTDVTFEVCQQLKDLGSVKRCE